MSHKSVAVPSEDPLDFFRRALSRLYTAWVSRTYPFASKGCHLSFHCTCQLSRRRAPVISLGSSIILHRRVWLNIAGAFQGRTEPAILIGDNCSLGNDTIISARNSIRLERAVLIAQSVLIMDHGHCYEDISLPIIAQNITEGGRIVIGEGCWIGHGAAIICNQGILEVGRHCVIGANAVVTRSVPPYSIVAGNPARVVKQYDPDSETWRSVRDQAVALPALPAR